MPHDPATAEHRRELLAITEILRVATAEATRRLAELPEEHDDTNANKMGHPIDGPRATTQAVPTDGEIRDGMIWINGKPRKFTPAIRKLLAYALGEGDGKSREEVCLYMGWGNPIKAGDFLRRFNERIDKKMKGEARRPHLHFMDGLRCRWQGAGAKAKESA